MDYEARKQARIDRLRKRADSKSAAAGAAHASAKTIADRIPFGQPILVGHHSERRARRDADRIDSGFQKAFDLDNEAKELRRRADAAEKSAAISSDDPEALTKLRARLAEAEAAADAYAVGIKAARKVERPYTKEKLAAAGVCADVAQFCLLMNMVPTNANLRAEVRRIAERIKVLEAAAATPPPPTERHGEAEIREDHDENRVLVTFLARLTKEQHAEMRKAGFVWAPSRNAYSRQASIQAWHRGRAALARMGFPAPSTRPESETAQETP